MGQLGLWGGTLSLLSWCYLSFQITSSGFDSAPWVICSWRHTPLTFDSLHCLKVTTMFFVHIHNCTQKSLFFCCGSTYTCVWPCLWRPEIDFKCPPSWLSTLVFETRSLTEPGAYWFSWISWPANPKVPPASASLALDSHVNIATAWVPGIWTLLLRITWQELYSPQPLCFLSPLRKNVLKGHGGLCL